LGFRHQVQIPEGHQNLYNWVCVLIVMKKRGASLVVASVLLVVLGIALALVIWNNLSSVVVSLAPEVDCLGMDFRADLVREAGARVYSLDVVNVGSLRIDGFYIKAVEDGEIYIKEEVLTVVATGVTESIRLTEDYSSGRYLVVPRVEAEDSEGNLYYKACKDIYGDEVVIE
jgi:hypothetical protein